MLRPVKQEPREHAKDHTSGSEPDRSMRKFDMWAPFRIRPTRRGRDYTASHLNKGVDYHEDFSSRAGRSLMWDLERAVLDDMLERVGRRRTLDFACGTGRVAGHLKQRDPDGEVHGVDISESMLDVAHRSFPDVLLHHSDGRHVTRELGAESFGLVTAFRFFANADNALRESAADQIYELLEPGGFLIFNNHRNFWSLSYFLSRLAARGGEGALNGRMEDLFVGRGMRIVERRSLGVWPQSEKKSYLLPWDVTRRIERSNLERTSRGHALGYNMIWLLQKV